MANLALVQVKALVDETDIGKIRPGLPSTVTVAAYPNRPFEGTVLKIEPQSVTEQNVTMFPVLVSVENRVGLLRPGMNCEVEIHVGRREGVLAIPNAALRTSRDVASAAAVLGLSEARVQEQLEPPTPPVVAAAASEAATPNDAPTGGTDSDLLFGGDYIVFALRAGHPTPVRVRTGLTDLDHSEVLGGLTEDDAVLVLPSASLVRSQQSFKERISRVTGDGLPGVRSRRR